MYIYITESVYVASKPTKHCGVIPKPILQKMNYLLLFKVIERGLRGCASI